MQQLRRTFFRSLYARFRKITDPITGSLAGLISRLLQGNGLFLSSAALFFLVLQPSLLSIPSVFLCFLVLRWVINNREAPITGTDALLALPLGVLMGYSFYKIWIASDLPSLVAERFGFSLRLPLAGLSLVLGVLSVGILAAAISSCGRLAMPDDSSFAFGRCNQQETHFLHAQAVGSMPVHDSLSLRSIGFILLTAAVSITLLSKSSPCYPLNDWVDTNIFFTIGKSLLHGKVLYRDIFDHKGPLLYFLFVLPAIVSETSFLGLYFLEIITAFFFLLFSVKIACLFAKKRQVLFLLPGYSFVVYSTTSFSHGGSVEELCLPLVTISLYFLVNIVQTRNGQLSVGQALLSGVFVGCVFWIKYTMVAMYFGYALVIIVLSLRRKQYTELLHTVGFVLLGFVLVTIPVLLYFVCHHALSDLWTVYFYDNLFLYGFKQDKGLLASELSGCTAAFRYNRLVFFLLFLTFFVLWKQNRRLFLCLFPCLVAMGFFLYMRFAYLYYSFLLCAFLPLGFSFLCNGVGVLFSPSARGTKKAGAPPAAGILLVFCVLLFQSSPNRYLFLEAKENLPQYKMAAIINESDDRTILNYRPQDVGLYTATGTIPNVRYFCTTNLPVPGAEEERQQYITDGLANFVLSRDVELDAPNYTLVDTEEYFFEDGVKTYYLYQRNQDS